MRKNDTEKYIEGFGAEYVHVDALPVNQIDSSESLKNEARPFDPLDEEEVEELAKKFEAGMIPTSIIVYQNEQGLYVVIDGNHRVEAAKKAGVSTLPAYVVRHPDPAVIRMMTILANRSTGGRGGDLRSHYHHALGAVKEGVSIKDAARTYGYLSEKRLADLNRARVVGDDLEAMGFRLDPARHKDSMLRTLHPLRNHKPVLKAAFEMIERKKKGYKQVAELVPGLMRRPSEAEKLQFLKDYENRPDGRTQGGKFSNLARPKTPVRFFSAMRALDTILEPCQSPADLHITDPREEDEARRLAHNLLDHLSRVF